MSDIDPSEILKPPSKNPAVRIKQAVDGLIPRWKIGDHSEARPYVKFKPIKCSDDKIRPAVEVGIKISF